MNMAPGVCVTSFRMLIRCSADLGSLRCRGLRLTPAATLTMNSWSIRNYCTEKKSDETPNTGKSNKKASASHSKVKHIQINSTGTHPPTDSQILSLTAQDIDITKLKLKELKTHLSAYGLSTKGKKDILLARLQNYSHEKELQEQQHHHQRKHQHQEEPELEQKQEQEHQRYFNDDDTKMHFTATAIKVPTKTTATTKTNHNTTICKDNTEGDSNDTISKLTNVLGSPVSAAEAETLKAYKPPMIKDASIRQHHFDATDDANKEAVDVSGEVSVEYIQGLPHLTVPLPSRNEKCRFALKPVSHKVSDFLDMLRAEDRGIDRATVLNSSGIRIASTCNIESLMDEPFFLNINDQTYKVVPPPRQKLAAEDINKLGDIRSLVSQLYEALHVGEYHIEKENELKNKLEQLKYQVTPLEQQKAELCMQATRRTNMMTWVGLGLMSVQFGILARLTWWEYSWDIMEPVTYFVTYGTAMACYAYFCVTKQDYQLPDVKDRQYLLSIHKSAKKQKFDIDKYNTLKREIAQIEYDLRRLHDPLNLQLPAHVVRSQDPRATDPNGTTDCIDESSGRKLTDILTTKVTSKKDKPTGFRLPFFDTKN